VGTVVNLSYCLWLDGSTDSGIILRQHDTMPLAYSTASSGALTPVSGLLRLPAAAAVAPSSGMTVTCDGFCALIASSVSSVNGAYRVTSMQRQNLTLTASNATNPRIDLIVIRVTDNGNSTSFASIETVDGTPAPTPSAPSPPAQSFAVAQILVPANSSTVTSGNITDVRKYTTPAGGILYTATTSAAPAGVNGFYGYDAANDRLYHISGSGVKQARTLPFAPVMVTKTTDTGPTSGTLTVLSTSVTLDGSTNIQVYAKWRSITSSVSISALVAMRVDSVQVDGYYIENNLTSDFNAGGGAWSFFTSSPLSAGTHTVDFQYSPSSSATLRASSTTPAVLRVSAVPL
jgi:hypothetical protein